MRDDGQGIDPAVLASKGTEGHYGMRGMPERAALMGGKLAVWSEVGAGTEIELRLPARAAYTGPKGGRLRTVSAGLRAVLRRRGSVR